MLINLEDAAARFTRHHPQHSPVTFMDELSSVAMVFGAHSDFLACYKKVDTDFIYDRQANLYLVGVGCRHVDLRASLYRYYGGSQSDDFQAADEYILSSMGMFKSRAGHKIYRSADFVVAAELRSILRDIEVLL